LQVLTFQFYVQAAGLFSYPLHERQAIHADGRLEGEWARKDGTRIKVRLGGRQVCNEAGVPDACELIAEDVTEQRALEDHLRHLVATDALTGLANYRRLAEALDAEIGRSARTGRTFAVLMFDLNGLKEINDRYSHFVRCGWFA